MMGSSRFIHTCICAVTVQVWCWLLVSGVGDGGTSPQMAHIKQAPCPCSVHTQCARPAPLSADKKESVVFTNGTSDFKSWDWESVTTVVATADHTKSTGLMCYAHSQKKKFGFQVPALPSQDEFNTSSPNIQKWKREVAQKRMDLRADVVVIDLVEIFHSSHVKLDALVIFLHHLKDAIAPISTIEKTEVMLYCVVPWKPPCVATVNKTDDCSFIGKVNKVCDYFLLSPQSYLYLKRYGCKARATIPATKLALGVDEYAVQGLYEDRLILGVPWHGFEYTCKQFNYGSNICLLNKVPIEEGSNETKCDIDSRVEISIGTMITHHYDHYKNHQTDAAYMAPYYNHYDNDTKVYKQVWFENDRSLRQKYQYAYDFGLKGIAVYTAEDLSQANSALVDGFNGGMWNWILHALIQKQVTLAPPSKYHADTVAGIAIGCMLLGIVLGIVFMVILFRVRAKKKIQRPFRKDAADEYHDDDDLNL